tara:strand:+ start:248 stop:1198 length:951 start_codon:yes stop_codon:yes gene_type:complete
MKIFVTGVAGFIGFSVAKHFLEKKNHVYGIDNLDDYYSTKLKKKRLKILKDYNKFNYYKIDLSNYLKLNKLLNKKNFDYVFHFAAQAGVRYSLINPQKYYDSNISGFINLMDILKKKNIKKIIYASSSSVYGNIKKFPSKETHKLMPINIYAQSKLLNEKISNYFCKKYKMKIIGLRFFTIYGKWGRPDMLLMKIFNSIKTKKTLHLNNYGNHYRDFTYIEDAVKIIDRLIYSKFSKNEIFNICSSNPIKILDICNIYKLHGLKYKKVKKHSADVFKTHGDNSKIKNNLKNIEFTDQILAIKKTFEWYKKYKIHKY